MQYLVPKTDENIKLLMHYVDASAVAGCVNRNGGEYIKLNYLPKRLKHLSQ